MKLVLLSLSIFVLGCLAGPLTFLSNLRQRVQQDLKINKKSVAALKQTYHEKISSLKRRRMLLPHLVEVPVAFSTPLQDDTTINESPVVFGIVNLNIGNGYDEFTGVFRPPVDGVYQLTFYGLLDGTNPGNVFIKRNDDVLCKGLLWDLHNTAVCTVIGELTTGDSVHVTGNNEDSAGLRGDSFSGFNGFLIYDYSDGTDGDGKGDAVSKLVNSSLHKYMFLIFYIIHFHY